jgi:Acetyltransferase (GNAT) domain
MSAASEPSTLAVERYDPAQAAAWDALVDGARQAHFLFRRDYMDYHADRFVDASLVVSDGGSAIAALPATRHDDEVVSHGGLTFGGLLSGPELTTARAVEALGAVADALRADGVRRLRVRPVPHIYHRAPAEEELYALHVHGARLVSRQVSTAVPAGAPVEYSSERRRAVRKGAKAGLVLGADDAIEEYAGLVAALLADRHDAEPVHSAAELRLLADRFPEAIRLFTARADGGELLAGVLVFETERVAHAQYIAASEEGRRTRAQDALFDHLLHERYASKPWFDFGTSHERDGSLNGGLVRNKEGFGARAVVQDQYVLELG